MALANDRIAVVRRIVADRCPLDRVGELAKDPDDEVRLIVIVRQAVAALRANRGPQPGIDAALPPGMELRPGIDAALPQRTELRPGIDAALPQARNAR